MSQETTPDPWGEPLTPPSEVQIKILPDPAARGLRDRMAHTGIVTRTRAIVGLALIAAVMGIAFAGVTSRRDRAFRATGAHISDRGSLGVAAAYGYPPRCLTVTIPANDPTYARADFDRSNPCGRSDGYATAIFHRVDGAWRPVLDAISYSCPVSALPPLVQVELGVCQ